MFGLQRSDFRLAGMYVAMSIMQGGPGIPVPSPAFYMYWINGCYLDMDLKDDDVPDPAVRELLAQVCLKNGMYIYCFGHDL